MSKKQRAAEKAATKPPKAARPAQKLATGWAEVADRDADLVAPAWPAEDGAPVLEPEAEPAHHQAEEYVIGFHGTTRGGWPTEDGTPVPTGEGA